MNKLVLCIIFLLLFANTPEAKTIKICTDTNFWYPYTYLENGKVEGMHVALVSDALTQLGHSYTFSPLPWVECLKKAETGLMDAVVSTSYTQKRAEYLNFPSDADAAKKSKWRVMQSKYVVVSLADNPWQFNGDVTRLPGPVRSPEGYSVTWELKSRGIPVVTNGDDQENFSQLVTHKTGVVISSPVAAKILSQKLNSADKIKIHQTPLASKSHFMAISKRSDLTQEDMSRIWEQIRKLRDDQRYILKLLTKHY